ncbi:phage virion morphogenesis protein [Thiocystis violascens]|uniref:Phage virion morphogenesis protein, putative tail completion n=1 Tax=Thiocystis violascens (strain ATCC 17096 / DSM 198 / 6111) TaxID=765911 RepID=I3YEH7_THIV6|nr:phage virion morphogenesis protein [Thiocystis violascens]AFL75395.1 phage virion morphogenesis protein, putative tail completion [Thiocystis violascens DSM 198]
MTGARQPFSVEIDLGDVTERLRALTARVGAPREALREIGEILQQSTQQRFATETDPSGRRWAENSDVTLLRALGGRGQSRRRTAGGGRTLTASGQRALAGKKILTRRGFLGDTIRDQLDADGRGVAVGTNRKYGAMMQFGGTQAQHPHLWGDIPARPFLGISTDDRARILEILDDYLGRP